MNPAALAVYNHLINRIDRFTERGWRRAFGWSGFVVAIFSYVYAPSHAIEVDYAAVNTFLAFIGVTFVGRGVETVARDVVRGIPGGGLVNNTALS